jgi:REP element-mobilizing transposase RayT
MARQLRFVYPWAVYHVMDRGDGGKKLALTDSDHLLFLDWLDGACSSHGWRIHVWVLMGNHFHLLLTPEHGKNSKLGPRSKKRQTPINEQVRSGTRQQRSCTLRRNFWGFHEFHPQSRFHTE